MKQKEAIRNQIAKKVDIYRKNKGILFFDESPKTLKKESYLVNDHELPVLLIKYKMTGKILVTTKSLILIQRNKSIRIDGDQIDSFEYIEPLIRYHAGEEGSMLNRVYRDIKILFRIGKYRIVKKDGSLIALNFRKARYPDCLNGCIKRLKFVLSKYDGV